MADKKRIVHVEWVDSATARGWTYPNGENGGTSTIKSVGYLLYEDKNHIELSTSISETGSSVDIISIPKSAIIKRKPK